VGQPGAVRKVLDVGGFGACLVGADPPQQVGPGPDRFTPQDHAAEQVALGHVITLIVNFAARAIVARRKEFRGAAA